MRPMFRWALVGMVAVGAGLLLWQKTRSQPVSVTVVKVEKGSVEKTVANTRAGTVKACRRARLSPSMGGQIARLPIREGDVVEAGTLLLEIWNDDLQAQLALAVREVGVATAQANGACLSSEEARRQAARAEQLFRNRVGSEEDTDRAVTRARTLAAECEASSASVELAKARVEVARTNLARTRLIAPFAGVIATIEGELNEYVTPSPVGVQTPPAVDLIENSCYYVSAPIDEVDAAMVRVGMESRISLDAFRGRHFAGSVRRIAPYVLDLEKQARTVDVETSFINESDFNELLAGYSADVEIIIATHPDTLRIPTEAVMDENQVYVYESEKEVVRLRTITTGLANWASTEVLQGLSAGELVVVNIDRPGLADGVSVTISEQDR